jgi:hypothetical protein
MRATIRSLGVISLAALAVAAKGGAQVKLEFTPFAGSYKPTGNLLPSDALSDFHIINIHQNAGVALGGRVTAWLTDRFAVDGSFGYLGSDVAQTVDAPCVDICEGPVTSDTRGHMWLVSARLLVVVGHGPAYAGHGDKDFHYGYGSNAGGTMTRSPGAVVGIGARVEFPRTTLALRMHLEDYLYPTRFSGYDGVRTWSSSQIQNALLLSLGLSVRSGRVAARQR